MGNSPLLYGPNNTSNNLQDQILLGNGQLLSNNGPKNYIKNSGLANGQLAGWSLFNTTLTGVIPTGSITTGSSAFTLAVDTNSKIASTNALLLQKPGTGSSVGNGIISDVFTIDAEDQAKVLSFKFSYLFTNSLGYNVSGTSSNTFAIYIYDVTNSAWIQPAGVYNTVQYNSIGFATGTFQTSANATQYRLAIIDINNHPTSALSYFDSFFVGPQVTSIGPAMSEWTSYTPTVSGLGTISSLSSQYRRIGDSLEVIFKFATGTPTATAVDISLPLGLSIDTTKCAENTVIGKYTGGATGLSGIIFKGGSSNVKVFYGADNSAYTGGYLGNNFGTSAPQGGFFKVPIQGWSTNTVQSADTDTRVVDFVGYNGNTQALTANTTLLTFTTSKDSHASWDGDEYSVPVSGDYLVALNYYAPSTGAVACYVQVNGVDPLPVKAYLGVASSTQAGSGSVIIPNLKSGDKISLKGDASVTLLSNARVLSIKRLSGPAVVQATESVNALYTGGPPTGTLSAAWNTLTYGTRVKDSHNAYSGGVWTCMVSGSYDISAQYQMTSTFTAGAGNFIGISISGASPSYYSGFNSPSAATVQNTAQINVKSVPLLAGQTVAIQSFVQGTSNSFAPAATNFFSITRSGN